MRETRVAVLGGTFNPIHKGHLHIADYVRRTFDLSRVYFVIAAQPPHKPLGDLISLSHRYAMVCLATQGIKEFTPSLLELEAPASPFSFDTLAKLAARSRGPIYFIAGGDSLLEVASWHRSEDLLETHNFVFVARPGALGRQPETVLPPSAVARVRDLSGLSDREVRRRARSGKGPKPGIFLVDARAPDISASRIRERARAGKRISHLVPGPVHEYIRKLHLYGEQ